MKFMAYALQFGDRGYFAKNQPANKTEWAFTRSIDDAYLYKTHSGLEKKARMAKMHPVYKLLNLTIVEVEITMQITSQKQWMPPEHRPSLVSSAPDADMEASREKLMKIFGKKT